MIQVASAFAHLKLQHAVAVAKARLASSGRSAAYPFGSPNPAAAASSGTAADSTAAAPEAAPAPLPSPASSDVSNSGLASGSGYQTSSEGEGDTGAHRQPLHHSSKAHAATSGAAVHPHGSHGADATLLQHLQPYLSITVPHQGAGAGDSSDRGVYWREAAQSASASDVSINVAPVWRKGTGNDVKVCESCC